MLIKFLKNLIDKTKFKCMQLIDVSFEKRKERGKESKRERVKERGRD